MLSATKRHLAVLGLALPALGGCGAKDLDPPPLPEMPPLRAPVAAVDPSATAEPAHLAEQRQSDAVMTMDACLRRSRARLDHAWARLLVDLDRESGVLLRDRRDVQPWVPAVRGDLIACHDPDALRDDGIAPSLLAPFTEYRALALTLADGFERLATYFDARAYESDDWALSRELVPQLADAHARWQAAADALSAELRPARLTAIETLLQRSTDVPADDPARVALALLQTSHRLEDCLAGPDLGRCAATSDQLSRPLAALEAWLEARPDASSIPFWTRALLKAGRELERVLVESQGSLRRGKLLPSQRQALDEVRLRLENAAETVRRDLATDARTPS